MKKGDRIFIYEGRGSVSKYRVEKLKGKMVRLSEKGWNGKKRYKNWWKLSWIEKRLL